MNSGSGAQTPTRLIGVAVNPLWAMLPKTPQKAIFNQGVANAEGYEGGWPAWAVADFTQVQPYDTVDTTIDLPDGFTVLAILAIGYRADTGAVDAFSFELYDVDREQTLFEKLVNYKARAGQGNSPLFEKHPYSFAPQNAQCTVRISEHDGNTANIQVILFGVVGGQQ